MAAISRHLPRGVVKAHCAALVSASHFEKNLSGFSGMLSGPSEEENSRANLDYRSELRHDIGFGGCNIHANSINPLELRKAVDLGSGGSCCSSRERCLPSFRSTAEHQSFVPHRTSVCEDHNLRRISPRASCFNPSPNHVRSVWTAVSAEDKLRPEVEDEEQDLTTSDDNLETTDAKKLDRLVEKGEKLATEEEIAESSIYSSAEGPSDFTHADVNKFFNLRHGKVDKYIGEVPSIDPESRTYGGNHVHVDCRSLLWGGEVDCHHGLYVREQYFGEGFPSGLLKEFDETKESAFLIRGRVLQLFNRFQKCLADTIRLKEQKEQGESARLFASKPRQCLLEGFVKGGKSAALAMLVHWARMQGWLVFYVPNGREWTSVGMYFKNAQTGLFDTPIQAKAALEGFLKSHEILLGKIPCRILKSIQLGEGAGTGKVRGPDQITLPEGATLRDLVVRGVAQSQAAVGCVVRLREEFNLVQEVPVLIAIDEFNSWFTFSSYHEVTGTRSRRPIHAHELSMVNAFRPMEGPLMMATAFSQSLAVGKLPVHLPGVPKGVRFSISRYNLEETTATLKYYHSRKVTHKEPTEEDIKKLFYLTNGNGEELRALVRLL